MHNLLEGKIFQEWKKSRKCERVWNGLGELKFGMVMVVLTESGCIQDTKKLKEWSR